jgi:polyphosphate kinase
VIVDVPVLPTNQLYINRELSLLEFNRRVLEQASDATVPILERLRFLCISSTNLDEFFEVRVASLMQRVDIDAPPSGPDDYPPEQLLDTIRERTRTLVRQQYELLNRDIFPELARCGIAFAKRKNWTEDQQEWLDDYFQSQVVPVLTPLTLDPSRPFPRMLNKSLNFIVRLDGKDAFGRRRHRAIVQAPRTLPRVIRLPEHLSEPGNDQYVYLSSIIHTHVDELFPGMQVTGCYQFRVTRNSNLYVDEEEVEDLVGSLEGQLAASRYGEAVRLEISHDCPEDLSNFLLDHFSLSAADIFAANGPVNLNRLSTICDNAGRPDLLYPPFNPGLPAQLRTDEDIFSVLRTRNVLLHHPYHSFAPVVDFIKAAAADPNVLAIKQTLYRTGANSPFVDHLVTAARAGKEVTVIIELMARFDEAENISLANRLQEAGAQVVYGLIGFKTHSKMLMVVRQERGSIRRYVHMGTGNYHPDTARLYTDYGFMSSNKKLGEDVHKVFMQLTSLTEAKDLDRVLTAPFTLFDELAARIQREIEHAATGGPARIIVKVNALIEPQIIRALYRASSAGVKIDLIVRGICSLRPGVAGLSENIRVVSIVGRFLEHSRVFYFYNDGKEEFFCSSADWMDRNFFHRNETCFPIRQQPLKKRLKKELELFLADNCQSWELHGDGSYTRTQPSEETPVAAQRTLIEQLASAIPGGPHS